MAGVNGTLKTRQHHPGTQQAWQAMRILRRFTVEQLVVTSPALRYKAACRYAYRLRQCGYLVLATKRPLGQPGMRDVLQLVRNSGPLAPIPRHAAVQVFDPNTNTTWAAGGLQVDQPAPARAVLPVPPPTPAQLRAVALLAAGRDPGLALADPDNTGAVARVLTGLRLRGLVDGAGALTPAGHDLARSGGAQ